ncbi:MAG: PAS domain-containing sensor histidine kinase [Oligoflexus sp.]|nr:PAS domain-containing sensor histidine kinase [Pseudopedobacter sp.]
MSSITSPSDDNAIYQETLKDNDYYKSIIDNNSFYVVKTDLEGKYTYLNPFFCYTFSLKAEDWIGQSSLSLIVPEDHQTCLDTVNECFTSPKITHRVILRKPIPKGFLSTQWDFKMLTNEEGFLIEILCIGHDITSLIIKQKELEALVGITSNQNKRLINFTYIVSHNIRSHVANILGIVNLNEVAEEEMDSKTALAFVKKSSTSLDQTIRALNDIISIQTNTQLPLSEINVQFEIKRIVDSIIMLFRNTGTVINYLFSDDKVLFTNQAYFESILLNLITNSLKYRSLERSLIINVDILDVPDYTILIFNDNGIGIDLVKNRDRLFGMFNTFNGNKDAKGMGLFITKTQIEAMKGLIEVESEFGKGTTFKIYFPKK